MEYQPLETEQDVGDNSKTGARLVYEEIDPVPQSGASDGCLQNQQWRILCRIWFRTEWVGKNQLAFSGN